MRQLLRLELIHIHHHLHAGFDWHIDVLEPLELLVATVGVKCAINVDDLKMPPQWRVM